jgi:hypothetical protein
VATITDSLPKKPIRPLSISGNKKKILTYFISHLNLPIKIETQVLDRYEKREKIRRDSITG